MIKDIPAFPMPSGPEPRVDAATHYNEGMSLRDYFAGMVISRAVDSVERYVLSDPNLAQMAASDEGRNIVLGRAALMAYEVADAMLVERQKHQ